MITAHVTRRGGMDAVDRRLIGRVVELWTGERPRFLVDFHTPRRGLTVVLPDTPQGRAALASPKLASYSVHRQEA